MRYLFKWMKRLSYSILLLIVGWLLNFFIDVQFALGVIAGWFMRQGYDHLGRTLLDFAR